MFGDLPRSVGTIGGEGIQTLENDTGPTTRTTPRTASTSSPGRIEALGRSDAHLLDIALTVLELLGIEREPGMRGESLPLGASRSLGGLERASSGRCWSSRGKDAGSAHIGRRARDRGRSGTRKHEGHVEWSPVEPCHLVLGRGIELWPAVALGRRSISWNAGLK